MLGLDDKLLLAPLAGYTDLIFRSLARRCGADVTVTEMVSIKGVVYGQPKTFELMESDGTDRPLGIQLFGNEPDLFAEAGAAVEARCAPDFIDVNCGCPVRKVLKQNSGAWLLQDPPRVGAIVRALKRSVKVPVSVKIRLGFSNEERNYLEVCRRAEENGADFITVHARTRPEFYSGPVDFAAVETIKRSVKVLVVGNGGVCDAGTYRRMKETGCDSVMIGQAAMGQPWVFGEIRAALAGRGAVMTAGDKVAIFREHVRLLMAKKGEAEGLRQSRSLAMQYLRKIFRGQHARKELMKEYYGFSTAAQVETFFKDLEGRHTPDPA
jgi:nifR3 family TIM-barrel protein